MKKPTLKNKNKHRKIQHKITKEKRPQVRYFKKLQKIMEFHKMSPVQRAQITDGLKEKHVKLCTILLTTFEDKNTFHQYLIKTIPKIAKWVLLNIDNCSNSDLVINFNNKP